MMYSIPVFRKFTSVLSSIRAALIASQKARGQSYCVEHYAYLKFIWLGHGDQDTDRGSGGVRRVVPWNSDDLSGRGVCNDTHEDDHGCHCWTE
jgi:hypothetical protein